MKGIKRNNIVFFSLGLVLGLIILVGCRKASDNGKIDGQWQIMGIENLETGKTTVPYPRRYIAINLHVVQLTDIKGVQYSGNMRYDKTGETLYWDFPWNKPERDPALESWGIYTNPVEAHILKLDNKSLVLKTPQTVIICRRF